jgi:stage II sporulation protein D
MKTPWQARLSRLKPIRLKSVQLKPLNLRSLRPWDKAAPSMRLKMAGGLVFAGLVLTQFSASPVSVLRSPSEPKSLDSSLWESTGLVRQSIVDLYRARRLLIQSGVVMASTAAPDTSAPAAAPVSQTSPSPQATAAAPSASSSPATPSQGAAKTLPQPQAPPSPAAASTFDPAKTIDTNLEMRVAVAKRVSSLAVATSVDGYLMDLNGQNYCNLPAQKSFILSPQGGGMAFGDCKLTNTVWLEPGEGGYVYVGDKWYKGRVLLMESGNAITAVNFVLMHDYLSSVVGSEMYVTWPLEALKAQAVAARSYALVHHVRNASRPYDLDNTQRYQAYLGIAKETNTTQAAVVGTTGEFISYNGGIVESLYAASDAIVQAAHGGNGMSQTGAMELASRGYSYTEILGNYYPNTSLSRLVVQ